MNSFAAIGGGIFLEYFEEAFSGIFQILAGNFVGLLKERLSKATLVEN
jgi:hypothetical protein